MGKVLVLASNNKGKLHEFQAMFGELGVEVINQGALGVGSCEEPFETFLENGLAKARHAARETGRPAMADDSGICADALGGRPGVYSARYAGEPCDDEANNRLLVKELSEKNDRRAHYTCVLVAVRSADDPEPLVAVGRWYGEIQDHPEGTGGFGYDPYFRLPQFNKTAAELTAEEKNGLSHRGQALRRMIDMIRESWGW